VKKDGEKAQEANAVTGSKVRINKNSSLSHELIVYRKAEIEIKMEGSIGRRDCERAANS